MNIRCYSIKYSQQWTCNWIIERRKRRIRKSIYLAAKWLWTCQWRQNINDIFRFPFNNAVVHARITKEIENINSKCNLKGNAAHIYSWEIQLEWNAVNCVWCQRTYESHSTTMKFAVFSVWVWVCEFYFYRYNTNILNIFVTKKPTK